MQLPKRGHITPTPEQVSAVHRLYDDSQLPKALETAQAVGPLHEWSGTAAMVMAGRLANHVGAPRLANFLVSSAYRFDRKDLQANYYRGSYILGSCGPLRALKFLRKVPRDLDGPDFLRADLLALEARALGMFRDFTDALPLIESALAMKADRPWLWCEKTEILVAQDKHQDAYDCARRALELNPRYRPSIQVAAETLQLLGRDAEALDLLTEADRTQESGHITTLLATLQSELGRHEDALRSWIRARSLQVLAEPLLHKWYAARLADAHYHVGAFEEAARHAAEVGMPLYDTFAERLKSTPRNGNRQLSVDFVAQYHLTCAPATLSALSRYWKVPVDHAALAAEICYEGTFDHVERDWAERAGFLVRDFRLTWDTARRLIDAGVPVALATVETTSAHLQALIGYDDVRGSLIFRDPGQRVSTEMHAEGFFTRYGASGPRASVMIPPSEAHRIEGIELTEAELYDDYYLMLRALEKHDREAAALCHSRMVSREPANRLTHTARRRLALYDANPLDEVEALTNLVTQFPENGHLLWSRSIVLSKCAAREEYHKDLRALANGPAAEPVFWKDWGREVGMDKRRLAEAKRYLTLAVRQQPCNADLLAELATLLWDEQDFATAALLFRFAACLPGGGERFGRSYFLASRQVRETEKALALLRKRFEDHASASVQPTRALIFALSVLDRQTEAFEVLEQALTLRPRDGELLLFAADEFARHNRRERAAEVLEAARAVAARSAWLRTAAVLAGYRCEHASALSLWREILSLEPLAGDAQASVARFLAETSGRAAALEFLESHVLAFPHHLPLHELCVEWYRPETAERTESVIRRGLGLHPEHAGLRRELALNLSAQGRHDEAVDAAREASLIEPSQPPSSATLGRVLQLAGRTAEATESYHHAITLSVDFSAAIQGLFSVAESQEEKRAAVDFVRRQLAEQVVFGDGVTTFREEAFPVLDPEEMLVVLRGAAEARRDLWQTGSALAWHLTDMKRYDEALAVAQTQTAAFPLMPRAWFDLSAVHKERRDWAQERQALEQALAINPTWSQASRALAEAYEREGDFEKCREVLRLAASQEPLDCLNHGTLADLLWKLGEKDDAIATLEHSLRLNPLYQWAWTTLATWSRGRGPENRALSLARELTSLRAGEASSWLRLVDQLPENEIDEKLDALAQAERIDPRNADVHDTRAHVLFRANRLEEARAAANPSVYEGKPPLLLRGRAAWIEASCGNRRQAVELMRGLVRESPAYSAGWQCLVEWLSELNKPAEALEAATALARLHPRAVVPLGYIGKLQLRAGKRKQALETFRKAFDLDPGYAFAGHQLFEAHLQAREYREAGRVLALLQKHHPTPQSTADAIRLACALKDKEKALANLRDLCFAPEEWSETLHTAANGILAAGWIRGASEIFREALNQEGVNFAVGTLWVQIAYKRFSIPPKLSQVLEINPQGTSGAAARFAYLAILTKVGDVSAIQELIEKDRAVLRENIPCWGQTGYALTTTGQHKEAAEWLSDWRGREKLESWMLLNLALSLRHLGNDAEAHEASAFAVTLADSNTKNEHQIYLAWDDVVAKDFASAQARLDGVLDRDLRGNFLVLRGLSAGVISVLTAEGEAAGRAFNEQKANLRQPGWKAELEDPTIQRYANTAVQLMAAHTGKRPFQIGSGAVIEENAGPIDSRMILLVILMTVGLLILAFVIVLVPKG